MNSREIQKLRKKFIFVSMLSLFIAMLFIGGMIFGNSTFVIRNNIYKRLDGLLDVETAKSQEKTDFNSQFRKSNALEALNYLFNEVDFDRSRIFFVVDYSSDGVAGEPRGNLGNRIINENGNSDDSFVNWKLSLSNEQAQQYADMAIETGKEKGRLKNLSLFFQIKENEDGSKSVALIDGNSEQDFLTLLLMLSIIVCAAGLLIAYFLVRILSRKAIAPEIENSRRQKLFITNASHELKTPLAVIRANTELEETLHGEDEWTKSTLNQVDRLNGLIQNLVMITRAEEREDKSEMSEINASKAVEESVKPFESLALQEEKTLETEIKPDVTVKGDESKVRQLTSLLVDNAIKYCDEKGTIRVSLSAVKQKSKNGIELKCSNSYAEGKNVDYKRFFDRFYREDKSHNIDNGGYGIGLSIAESICKQYNGSIEVSWSDGVITFVCKLF